VRVIKNVVRYAEFVFYIVLFTVIVGHIITVTLWLGGQYAYAARMPRLVSWLPMLAMCQSVPRVDWGNPVVVSYKEAEKFVVCNLYMDGYGGIMQIRDRDMDIRVGRIEVVKGYVEGVKEDPIRIYIDYYDYDYKGNVDGEGMPIVVLKKDLIRDLKEKKIAIRGYSPSGAKYGAVIMVNDAHIPYIKADMKDMICLLKKVINTGEIDYYVVSKKGIYHKQMAIRDTIGEEVEVDIEKQEPSGNIVHQRSMSVNELLGQCKYAYISEEE